MNRFLLHGALAASAHIDKDTVLFVFFVVKKINRKSSPDQFAQFSIVAALQIEWHQVRGELSRAAAAPLHAIDQRAGF